MENPVETLLLPENSTDYIEEETVDDSTSTAHRIGHDPWYQISFIMIVPMNSAYVLGYSGILMVPLGWVAGIVGFIAAALFSFYANYLLACLHQIDGVRQIRYRDLAGHIYGKNMYYFTWALQYLNLFMANIGFIILAGEALKAIYTFYNNEGILKLPYCIVITGIACSIFAFGIPHLSSLRLWLGVSTFMSLIYIIIVIVLSIKDGLNNPSKDYEISGSKTTKFFNTMGAAANTIFVYNSAMLPEIQICASPTYEYLDTKYGRMNESVYSVCNWIVRLVARGTYMSLATLMAAMFPFLGDFVTLTSAVCMIPLTFVLPNHMYIKVKGKDLNALDSSWHWLNVLFFTFLALAGAIASLRSIVNDYKTYHLFADLSS